MGSPQSFTHQALIYSSWEEFLSAAIPFIEAGLAADEAVFVMTDPPKAAAVRDVLGDEAKAVSFADHRHCYDVPARRLNEFYRLYAEQQARGGRIRVVGEPVWAGCSNAQIREWKRFESLANLAYARFPCLALCPYNACALPPSVLADAYCTHPELVVGSRVEESPAFIDTAAFMGELDHQGLDEREVPWEELAFHGDLDELRRFVVAQAVRIGVAGTKLAELRWAANEIATNVIRHAGADATVRTWSASGEFVCEIADRGPGIEDPLVGRLPPELSQELAPGLWLVHQLCDLVELHSESGLTVRLHVMVDRRDFQPRPGSIASRFSA